MQQLILVLLTFLLCVTATRADKKEPEFIWAMLGNFAASCDNMTVVRLPSDDWEFGSGARLGFDLSTCKKRLKTVLVSQMYKPVVDFSSGLEGQEPLRPIVLQSLRNFFEDIRYEQAVKQTHERARPLYEACKSALGHVDPKLQYICYFGGPATTSNTAFKAHFQTLVDASLPKSETICSPDPIRRKSAAADAFSRLLDSNQTTLEWLALQTGLQAEGYTCKNDTCVRAITGIYIPSEKLKQSDEFRGLKIEFLIIPRLLSIYRGDWRPLGGLGCLEDRDGNKSGICTPSKGTSSGICMSVEGGRHGIGFLIMGLNGIK